MNIKTKFKIGDEVYIIFKEDGIVKLFRDKIEEIAITKEHIVYYVDFICEEFEEYEIVLINNHEDLIKKIIELTGGDE